MVDQWFYGQDEDRKGPYTSRQLRALADSGQVLDTDMVWKSGTAQGALAWRIKNLFEPPREAPAAPAAPLAPFELAEDAALQPEVAGPVGTTPAEAAPAEMQASETRSYQSNVVSEVVKKARAVAVRGVKIVGQDGTYVQFRKVCTKCGHEDASRSMMPIRNGSMRMGFFCPKCKKMHQSEIHGKL